MCRTQTSRFCAVAVLVAALTATGCAMTSGDRSKAPATVHLETPPVAARKPVMIEQLGRTRVDPYQWLKDANWQAVMTDPSLLRADIRGYLEAENAWTEAQLEAPTQGLQDTLVAEMRARIKEDDSTVPEIDGPFAYYVRYRQGGEYPIFARRSAEQAFDAQAPETVLLDGDREGAELPYFSVADLAPAPNHQLVAFAVDDTGSEAYTLRVREAVSGRDTGLAIPSTAGTFVWSPDSSGLYWVKRDENARPSGVYYRALNSTADVLVYDEPDPGLFVSVHVSASKEFVFVVSSNRTTSEVRYIAAGAPPTEPKLIAPRQEGNRYSVFHFADRFVILTNLNGAVDFQVMTAPIATPDRAHWAELIPHRPGTLILGLEAYADYLVRLEREAGLPRLVVRARADNQEHVIAFDEAAYSLGFAGAAGDRFQRNTLRFSYASPATPEQVVDYSMASQERVLRKTREVPSGHDPAAYIVERLMAPARDGEQVPITVLRRRSTPVDGSAPLFLYGYGSYGMTIPAAFSTARLSLVDRGLVYAIVHPRGGMAKGYQWYLDGKLEKKENTFNDYVDAGKYLVKAGYTARGRIVGMGGSAGGLLIGAVANAEPTLFAGLIASVPFVDVLNTMSDESLPLTPPEWPEWGNPITDPAAYDTILAYSPYDQIQSRAYPPMLITGGLSDPRVTYWEPAKFVARLRYAAPQAGPYFLRINMSAGHGGASGRFERLKETALEYAFALATLGKAGTLSIGQAGAVPSKPQ